MSYPNSQSNPAAAIPVWVAPAPGQLTENIISATSTLIKTGSGVLLGFSVNTAASGGTIKFYDGTDAGGTLLGTWDAASQTSFLTLGYNFAVGLFAVTAGGSPPDITVAYI